MTVKLDKFTHSCSLCMTSLEWNCFSHFCNFQQSILYSVSMKLWNMKDFYEKTEVILSQETQICRCGHDSWLGPFSIFPQNCLQNVTPSFDTFPICEFKVLKLYYIVKRAIFLTFMWLNLNFMVTLTRVIRLS